MLDENIDVLLRPKTLSKLFGSAVEKQIKSIVNSGLINHTYLFAGPPGVGKTTLARNMAKFILTRDEHSELELGDTMAFTEVNGTKYGGKDEMKSLVDQIVNPPISGEYIILLIDEAQGLTTQAQSVLLKIMEEPPPHLYIFLCTTDKEKIRLDIRDRCYKLDFPSLSPENLMGYARQYVIPTLLDKMDSKGLDSCKANLPRLSESVLESIASGIASPSLREMSRRVVKFLLTGENPVADMSEESDSSKAVAIMINPVKTQWRNSIKNLLLQMNDANDSRIKIANSIAYKLRTEIQTLTVNQIRCYTVALGIFTKELDYTCSKADLAQRIFEVTLSTISELEKKATWTPNQNT